MTWTIPSRMAAVQLVGHGGFDKLCTTATMSRRRTPDAGAGEVLLRGATGAAAYRKTGGWRGTPASSGREPVWRSRTCAKAPGPSPAWAGP